jgi:Ca-activated chloride channel family protein
MEALSQFHFLRPWFLLLLFPFAWFIYLLWIKKSQDSGLENIINQQLLEYLTKGKAQKNKQQHLPILGLSIIWFIVILGLAGPTWKKLEQPLYSSEAAVVIILDLSPSMRAQDTKPSRIQRAHLKILDVLSERKGGLNALIVYGGEAHIVTPLSNDTDTLENLLPSLVPGILPIPGSNVEMAVELAVNTLQTAGVNNGSLLLVTDGIDKSAINTVKAALPNTIGLTVIGIGTEKGAPIPLKEGFIKDDSGNTVIAKRNSDTLQAFANATNGHYLPLQADNSDVLFFTRKIESQQRAMERDAQSRNSESWHEFGPTLLLLLIPLMAMAFRRGWLLQIVCVGSVFTMTLPEPAYASFWDQLWKNKDQRGQQAWDNQDYDAAAKTFKNKQWQGSAEYKNKNYEGALSQFKQDNSATGLYNQGNAHAQLGQFEEAIKAYDQALAIQPEFPEAEKNKKLLEELQQQQQNQQQGDQQNNQENQDQQNQDNQNQSQDSQSQNQQDSDNQENSQGKNQESNQKDNEQSQQQDSQKNESEEKENEQAQQDNQSEQNQEQSDQQNESQQNLATAESELSEEEQQALQQWLRKVPDDPSGLLRRKFQYEFEKRRQQYQQGDWQLPENKAHKRY